MKIGNSSLCAVVAGATCALCGGIAIAQDGAGQHARDVKLYTFGELNTSQYEIVGRPWVDSWRSAFWVPTFPTREQAIAALQTEASARGADGLLNVSCLDQGHGKWSSSTQPAILCYGIAIRVRPSPG
jgi:hypothetical protein